MNNTRLNTENIKITDILHVQNIEGTPQLSTLTGEQVRSLTGALFFSLQSDTLPKRKTTIPSQDYSASKSRDEDEDDDDDDYDYDDYDDYDDDYDVDDEEYGDQFSRIS